MPRSDTRVFKTGERVLVTGNYVDQYGVSSFHEQYRTFPPCIGRKGECAFRRLNIPNIP